MNNCLVTTLKAAVNDNSLFRMGEMVIDVKEMSSPTNNTNKLSLDNGGISDFSLEVENGEANLTLDSNMSSGWSSTLVLPKNNAEQTVYFRNGNYRVRLISKYNIILYKTSSDKTAIGVDVKYLQFSNKATSIIGSLNGDISKLAENTSLSTLYCEISSNLSGDIASIKNLTKLNNLRLIGNYSGDIANISTPSSPMDLDLESPNLTGDIISLANKTNIKTMNLVAPKVTGDIASLGNLTLLTRLFINNNKNIYGDIASLNSHINMVSFTGCPNIIGDITSAGNWTSLTNFYFFMTQVRGEVIDLVIAQRSNGRASGKIIFESNNIVTFNSKVLGGINTISWTDSTITNETTSETVNR